MRTIANDVYIEKRTKIARVVPLIAFGFLIAAIIILLTRPEFRMAAFTLVVAGFILSTAGNYLLDHFSQHHAYHIKLSEALKGLDDTAYTLMLYRLPIPFVVVGPEGVTVILVKNHGGQIAYQDGKWEHHQRGRLWRRLGGQEALGKPDQQVQALVARFRKYLAERLPEDIEVPVRGIVVFTASGVQLSANDAPVPALRASKLRGWFCGPGRCSALPAEVRRQLAKALDIK